MPTAATTMSGMAGPIGHSTGISRATGLQQPIRAAYHFLTIRPVPCPGRTPRIHVAVSGRASERFITQMYVAGEPGDDGDPVLTGVRDPAARARLIVALRMPPDVGSYSPSGVFDIVLGRLEHEGGRLPVARSRCRDRTRALDTRIGQRW